MVANPTKELNPCPPTVVVARRVLIPANSPSLFTKVSSPSNPVNQKTVGKGSFESKLVKATLEKRKHSPLLLELPKPKKLKKDLNPQKEVITINEEGMQKEDLNENKQGQGSGGSGGRRSAHLPKATSKVRKGKQKITVYEEEDLDIEEFEAHIDEDFDEMAFEDSAYDMEEEDLEEENDEEEEQIKEEDQENENLTIQDVGNTENEINSNDSNLDFMKSRLTYL